MIKIINRYTVTVNVSEQKPYQVRENKWCFAVPPRCSSYRMEFKTVYKTEVCYFIYLFIYSLLRIGRFIFKINIMIM